MREIHEFVQPHGDAFWMSHFGSYEIWFFVHHYINV